MVAKTTNYTPKVIFCEFAEIPNAVTNAGNIAVVTDRSNATFISDGITWNAFAAKFNATFTALINPITGAEITFGGGSGGSSTITLTASRALASTDNSGTLVYSGSSDIILTINSGLSASGFSATVIQAGLGKVTMLQGSGVGFDNAGATVGINTFFIIVQQSANQYAFQNPVPSGAVPFLISGIPFVHASGVSMNIANNGALSGVTALPAILKSAYVYMIADSIGAGVPAGWYYAVFSSTSAATLYNYPYIANSGNPIVPASLTGLNFATTGIGAYTQVLTEVIGPSFTLPGGSLGKTGQLECNYFVVTNNTANNRVFRIKTNGGASIICSNTITGTSIAIEDSRRLTNLGAQDQQILRAFAGASNTTTAPTYGAINTATDQLVELGFNLGAGATADYIILMHAVVNITRGA